MFYYNTRDIELLSTCRVVKGKPPLYKPHISTTTIFVTKCT